MSGFHRAVDHSISDKQTRQPSHGLGHGKYACATAQRTLELVFGTHFDEPRPVTSVAFLARRISPFPVTMTAAACTMLRFTEIVHPTSPLALRTRLGCIGRGRVHSFGSHWSVPTVCWLRFRRPLFFSKSSASAQDLQQFFCIRRSTRPSPRSRTRISNGISPGRAWVAQPWQGS